MSPGVGVRRSAAAARLIAAFGEPGCPVCRALDADARRALAAYLREQTMDPAARTALRAAGGFCAWHTGLLRDAADGVLSVALIAETLLGGAPMTRQGCPACAPLRDQADVYLSMLLDARAVPALRRGVEVGPGLPCRPHLRRLLSLAPDAARVAALEQALAPRLARLRAALAGFIGKQDYRSREPPTAEEARAWSEALEHLAGSPSLFGSDLGPA